jgi:threonine/homoserine/homoserine lactone efflux protein
MLEASTLAVFAAAAFLILLIPGPAIFDIVTRGINQGRSSALVTVLGVQAGDVVHVTVAAAGLTTILVSSPVLFSFIKWAGGAYLVMLGLRSLRTGARRLSRASGPTATLRQCFVQGMAVNILNPGTALFYFSFLPQFVDPPRGSAGMQMVVLGMISMAIAAVIECAWALLAGRLGRVLHGSPRALRMQSRVSAGIYVVLGVAASGAGLV